MKVSVLVATYGRREYLDRCVRSLIEQTRPPDELVLVTRRGDVETESYVTTLLADGAGGLRLRHAVVEEPGVLAANRAGLQQVTGDLLCFIDDDATAWPDWIEKIERGFAGRPDVGAIGGRDLQHTAGGVVDEPAREVGRIRWYGRIIGNHNRRWPGVHEVESLKGCNMSFRRSLVTGFDGGILGSAHYYEMDLCFGVRNAGYRVLYDGDLVVDHFVDAPRYLPGSTEYKSTRTLNPDWLYYMHHNRVYVMMKNLPAVRRAVFLAYTFASDALAGAGRWLRGGPMGRPEVLRAVFRGKLEGLRRYRRLARRRHAGGDGR